MDRNLSSPKLTAKGDKPLIAITVGDVAGVGPELAIRCARLPRVTSRCHPILYGPRAVLSQIADVCGEDLRSVTVRDIGSIPPAGVQPGRFDASTGRASFEAVDQAVTDAAAARYTVLDATVTAPADGKLRRLVQLTAALRGRAG